MLGRVLPVAEKKLRTLEVAYGGNIIDLQRFNF